MPRPPAPEIDHPYVFSVSQVESFLLCQRLWAFDKIDKIKVPEKESTKLGGEVHDMAEAYLKHGIPIDKETQAGSILMSGFHYLPAPKTPGMTVEEWFVLESGSAVYRGLKDIEIIPKNPGLLPQVKDHKTTGNFQWMKTPDQLLKDIQAGIYAADAMRKTSKTKVELEWIYYRTKGARKSLNSKVIITSEHVKPILDKVEQTAQKMIRVLNNVEHGIDAEPNFSSCSAYGGCPHKNVRCTVNAKSALTSMFRQKVLENKMGKDTASFLASLRNRDKSGASAKTSEKKPEKEKEKTKPSVGITSPERSEQKDEAYPQAPAPIRIEGKLYTAVFNEDLWEYVWPDNVQEFLDKKKESKPKTVFTNKKKSEDETVPRETKKKEADKEVEEEADLLPEAKPGELLQLFLNSFADLIATRVAEKLKK